MIGMGGIAGSQTLTLAIRGLALGQVQRGNIRTLLSREVGISILNGVLWAVVVALAIPLILDRMGIDPALAGSVILTTVTDVVGFFAFLGLATVLLI